MPLVSSLVGNSATSTVGAMGLAWNSTDSLGLSTSSVDGTMEDVNASVTAVRPDHIPPADSPERGIFAGVKLAPSVAAQASARGYTEPPQLDTSDDWTSVGEPIGDETFNSTIGSVSMQEPASAENKEEEKAESKDVGSLADSQEWVDDSVELLS